MKFYPENVKFIGLDAETDRRIYGGLLRPCLGEYDSDIEDRIKAAGYMRMIYILAVRLGNPEKYSVRIKNAVKNLSELCGRIESLVI